MHVGDVERDAEAGAMTLGAMLRRRARIEPDRIAYRFGDRHRSFGEVDARVDRLATALADRGVGHGDRVATMMFNGIEHFEVLFATARLGAIFVPINFRLAPDEVEYILTDAEPTVVVVDDAAVDLDDALFERAGVRTVLSISSPRHRDRDEDYEVAVATPANVPPVTGTERDPVLLMYTSGTTGRPKGALLSHFNIVVNTFTKIITHGITGEGEVWMSALPMCHIAGVSSIFPCLMLGGTCVVLGSRDFDPEDVVGVLEREHVTHCFLVPTQWQQVCAVPDAGRRATHLRQIAWGGSIAPMATLEAMAATFPDVSTYSTFGQTEMSPLTCVLNGRDAVRKMGSVGRPVPNLELRIVDDEMRDVPDGEVGEAVYRGPTMLLEYWRDPAATAAAFQGGWFHSGDLVRRDSEGFVYVVDRKKDMIISGGENIYSAEVEAVILRHPAVREVALIGMPHPKWVETPVAVIVVEPGRPVPTLDEIAAWCRESLASFKKPTDLRVVDALPRNAGGKVLKKLLREAYG